MTYHDCKPGKFHRWAPGSLHGADNHDEATEWMIFKRDPEAPPASGDITPVGDFHGLTYFQAEAICEAHNRDIDFAIIDTVNMKGKRK